MFPGAVPENKKRFPTSINIRRINKRTITIKKRLSADEHVTTAGEKIQLNTATDDNTPTERTKFTKN